VNAEVNDGMTAISIAQQQGHEEIVEAIRSAQEEQGRDELRQVLPN
jgi:hypothetical protein